MSKNDDALRRSFDAWWAKQWPTLHKHANEKRSEAWAAWKAASQAMTAENEAQAALLRQITLTAHCGGLVSMSEADALIAIRKLTLAQWAVLHCLGETEIRQHLAASSTQQQWDAYAASRNRNT